MVFLICYQLIIFLFLLQIHLLQNIFACCNLFFLFGLILLFHGKTSWNISLEKTNFAAECFYEYFVALFWSIQSQLPTLTANKNFSAYLDHSLSGSDCDCFNEADLDFCSVKSWAWKSTLGSEKTWTTSLAIINNYCRRDQRLTLPILDPTKTYCCS